MTFSFSPIINNLSQAHYLKGTTAVTYGFKRQHEYGQVRKEPYASWDVFFIYLFIFLFILIYLLHVFLYLKYTVHKNTICKTH